MKYWRGYLVAALIGAFSWGLIEFAQSHWVLVDMIYPYTGRMIQDFMAAWSSGAAYCLWQLLLLVLAAGVLASIVMMIIWKWNPIQWFGWVMAVVSLITLLNTGLYGLNKYAGPVSEDVRLEMKEYSVGSLERATNYYRDMENEYAAKVGRNSDGTLRFPDFEKMAEQAADGFHYLAYQRTYPTFTGSTEPVKELGWSGLYGSTTGMTVALTGESAVNPNVPEVGLPFAICHEMSHRMCVYSHSDADFAAFLACTSNSSPDFQYSGYLMAFRQCYNALRTIHTGLGQDALNRVMADVDDVVLEDMEVYNDFLGKDANAVDDDLCKMLVSWHIQEIAHYDAEEEEDIFDPMDESDERLQDILNPTEG